MFSIFLTIALLVSCLDAASLGAKGSGVPANQMSSSPLTCGSGLNSSCPIGQCCSAEGKCSAFNPTSPACGVGCQPNFGKCSVIASLNRCGPDFKNQKCGSGACCSQFGWCGSTNTTSSFLYCADGCQAKFGKCFESLKCGNNKCYVGLGQCCLPSGGCGETVNGKCQGLVKDNSNGGNK